MTIRRTRPALAPRRSRSAKDWERLPVASDRSVFARYQRREGLAVGVGVGVSLGCIFGIAAGLAVLGGPLWGLLGAAVSLAGAGWMANAGALFGNEVLEARLRESLTLPEGALEFVGICRGDQNSLGAKLFPPRIETDENVGFLRLTADRLELFLEGQTLVIPRTDLRDVRTEPVVEAPFLSWIRLELYEGDRLCSFLLMSRQAQRLRDLGQVNRRLYDRLRDWHCAHQLRPLVESGELPLALLGPAEP